MREQEKEEEEDEPEGGWEEAGEVVTDGEEGDEGHIGREECEWEEG